MRFQDNTYSVVVILDDNGKKDIMTVDKHDFYESDAIIAKRDFEDQIVKGNIINVPYIVKTMPTFEYVALVLSISKEYSMCINCRGKAVVKKEKYGYVLCHVCEGEGLIKIK